jgi:hypothetical protein
VDEVVRDCFISPLFHIIQWKTFFGFYPTLTGEEFATSLIDSKKIKNISRRTQHLKDHKNNRKNKWKGQDYTLENPTFSWYGYLKGRHVIDSNSSNVVAPSSSRELKPPVAAKVCSEISRIHSKQNKVDQFQTDFWLNRRKNSSSELGFKLKLCQAWKKQSLVR